MLNSRKLFKALAVTGLLTLGSVASYAQTAPTCTGPMQTSNLGVRPEGLTELSGDIIVTCNAGTNLPPNGFTVLVQLTSNVDITNSSTTVNPVLTTSGGTLGTVSYPSGFANTISFQVGALPTATETGFQISGIRINANKASGAGVTSVSATLIVTTVLPTGGTTVFPLSNNPSLVATILPKSLNFTVIGGSSANATGGAKSLATCVDSPVGNAVNGFFRFSENFTNVLRQVSNPPPPNEEGPGASQGTQLRVVLSGLPAGTSVYVPNGAITLGNNILTPASGIGSGSNYTGAGYAPYTGTGSSGATGDPVYGGSYGLAGAEAVFNVQTNGVTPGLASSVTTLDVINIPFIVKFTAGPTVGIGTAVAKGTLAPINGTTVVRFADVGESANAFLTNLCSTTLLFPYVTTDAGFDTGLAISNTTADPTEYSTVNQAGACKLTPYGKFGSGSTVPAAGTSPSIAAGTTWAFSLTDSAVFPSGAKLGSGFNGYLIAQCSFQLGHGYAFISTYGLSGANSVAQGYLALVLQTQTGSRSAVLGSSGSEELAH